MRTLLAIVTASVVLLGSVPATLQAQSTTTGTIEITDEGQFNVAFCTTSFNLTYTGTGNAPVVVTSATGAVTEGRVSICITDSQAYREAFTLDLSAMDFIATDPAINATISAENLYVQRVIRPRHAAPNHSALGAGTIYSLGSDGSTIGPATTGDGSSRTWTSLTYDLATPRTILRGDAGFGIQNTTSGAYVQPGLYLNLEVPAGQRPATYRAQVTLTVSFAAP